MKTALIAMALLSTAAHADEWHGRDKQLHFIGGVAVAAAVTAATGDEWKGFLASTAVGIAKEVYDSTGRGHVSAKDAAMTALGALLGAKFTGWALSPDRITYTRRINIF
jgi:uncharacterized protein YfiM (DUF2279 family)